MSGLQTTKSGVPANIQDIAREVLIGRDRLDAIRAAIRSAKKTNKPTLDAMKAEGREYGERILDYEVMLADYFKSIPKASGRPEKIIDTAVENKKTSKMQIVADMGFEQKEVERISKLTPESVEKAKAVARENNDIPTRSLALQIARQERKETQLADARQSILEQTKNNVNGDPPVVRLMDCQDFINKCKTYDLLLTDPPYSTDIEDIAGFVNKWLYPALERVKPTGSAYIFIGAYPKELQAYLNAEIPDNVCLEQILIWTYKNTGGKIPTEHYKQNYQACLYYRGINAGQLDNKDNEFWAVTEINAPDGRIGDRYHAWQKPMELAEMYIRHSTKKGDRVVDPFCCTGTLGGIEWAEQFLNKNKISGNANFFGFPVAYIWDTIIHGYSRKIPPVHPYYKLNSA